MIEARQRCPICSLAVDYNERYPRYLCRACAGRALSHDGRALDFYNVDFSGGYTARYADTEESYPFHECYIDGVACWADEARFGGIVIQTVV